MKCDDQILYYIENNYKTFDEKIDFLIENGLPFHLYPDVENESLKKSILSNRIYELATQKEITKINKLFSQNNISAIFFKGVILSHQLYPKTFMRKVGDIDLFVLEGSFETAANILLNLGYNYSKPEKMLAEHHVVLNNDMFFIELHKSIYHPMIRVEENYLKSNIKLMRINDESLLTFNTTATLLHLIYHLYMDTYLTAGSLYNIFANKSIPKAGRFLYRAYEIALFSEKYYNRIKWEDIIEDIKKQKLRIIFKKMIMDILDIFPGTFPNSFIYTVYNLDYMEYEWDRLYNDMLASNKNYIGRLLCNHIDFYWALHKENNIHIKIGDSFNLIKNSEMQQSKTELSCNISTKKTSNGIELTFAVSDDDFYFSDIESFDTLASDGVHLLLCSTEKYSYNSIFFFPKIIDNKIKVLACNVLNNANIVLDADLVKTNFSETKGGYIISAFFSNNFIINNHIKDYFYMGLVISDCNSKEKHRTNEIILSEVDSEWYNPIYFAKIDMNE